MKIVVLVPVWKRPEVFQVMADNFNYPSWAEVTVVCVLSPEDPNHFDNEMTCLEQGFITIEAPNLPVGKKMNEAIGKLLTIDWDYMMGLNSDDILDPNYWDVVRPYLQEGHPMVGMRQILAWDVPNKTGKKLILEEDNTCKVWGGGRLLSREAIEKTYQNLGYVYQDDLNSGLDTSSQRNIFENNIFFKGPIIIDDDYYLVDLKTEENINPYFSLKWIPNEGVDYQEVTKKFGDIVKFFEK